MLSKSDSAGEYAVVRTKDGESVVDELKSAERPTTNMCDTASFKIFIRAKGQTTERQETLEGSRGQIPNLDLRIEFKDLTTEITFRLLPTSKMPVVFQEVTVGDFVNVGFAGNMTWKLREPQLVVLTNDNAVGRCLDRASSSPMNYNNSRG